MEQITKSNSSGEKGSESETVHVHAGILLFTPKLLYFLIVSFFAPGRGSEIASNGCYMKGKYQVEGAKMQ